MAENVKTLLVIGNGFDLAHGLNTKYTDFLNFIHKNININRYGVPNDYEINNFRQYQNTLNKTSWSEENLMKCVNCIGNTWLGYFNTIRAKNFLEGREDWIDFEREIELVIKQIEQLILRKISANDIESNAAIIMGNYLRQSSEVLSQELVPRLNWDLKILTLLLERYLLEELVYLKSNRNPFFEHLNPSAVISYNYTDTFSKLYALNNKIPVYFIHGEIGKHNLVLGIGETLSEDEKNKFTICASFKKFFQSVKYKLGNQYKNIKKLEHNGVISWHIVIYGHSLDPTDKDSLYWLMKKFDEQAIDVFNASKISIYYYDENAYNQQIANAIQIIGKEELIEAVNSNRIVFNPVNNNEN